MTSRIIILIGLTFLLATLHAQTPSVSLITGEKERTPTGEGTIGVVGTDKGGFYVLRARINGGVLAQSSSNAKLSMDYYDYDMELIKSFKIPEITMEIGTKAKKSYEFCTQDESDNLYLYYSDATFKNKTNTLYRLTLNKRDYTFGSKKKISNQKFPKARSDRRGSYGYFESADKSKKAILSLALHEDRLSTMAFIHVIDQDHNTLWKRTTKLPFQIRRNLAKLDEVSMLNQESAEDLKHTISVSNDGIVNMLLRVKRRNRRYYDYHLVSVSKDIRKVSKSILRLAGSTHEITDALMSYTPEGNVLCTGFYGDQRRDLIEGITIQEFTSDSLKVISKVEKDFSNEEKRKILVSEDAKSNSEDKRINRRIDNDRRTRIWDRNLLQIIKHKNNTYTLVTESFKEKEQVVQPRAGIGTPVGLQNNFNNVIINYEFGDLVCFNFNQDGTVNWIKNFEKIQDGDNITIMSSAVHTVGDNVYMIYNSSERKSLFKQNLKYAVVTSTGEFHDGLLATLNRKSPLERFFLAAKTVQPISDNELIGFAFRGARSKALRFFLK